MALTYQSTEKNSFKVTTETEADKCRFFLGIIIVGQIDPYCLFSVVRKFKADKTGIKVHI